MSQIWIPKDASLLPVICGTNHMNLLFLERALADGALKAESQGGGIRLDGTDEAVATAELALTVFETVLAKNPNAGVPALEGAIQQARTPDQQYLTLTGLKVPSKPNISISSPARKTISFLASDLRAPGKHFWLSPLALPH